jgi:hypothetical protein
LCYLCSVISVEESGKTCLGEFSPSAIECDEIENHENLTTEREEEKWQVVVRKGKRTLTGLTNNDPKRTKRENEKKLIKLTINCIPLVK